MDVRKLSLFAIPKRIDWHAIRYSYGIIWPWGPVTRGQILNLVFRGRHAWFTYKKHSDKTFPIEKVAYLYLQSTLSHQWHARDWNNNWQELRQRPNPTPLALVSSSGASDVQPRPRPAAACVYVCVCPTARHSILDNVGLTGADNPNFFSRQYTQMIGEGWGIPAQIDQPRGRFNIIMSAISIKFAVIGYSWALITNIKLVFEYILPFRNYSLRRFWHLSWHDSMLLHFLG